jgi:S-adenosylmethionine:tRNA ribosyltransferase-isomerase
MDAPHAGPGAASPHALPADFDLASYDYVLPPELIAQSPAEPRDSARLLVLDRGPDGARPPIQHLRVSDLPSLLSPGDLIVANRSRVLPCRLHGTKTLGGGRIELLLIRPRDDRVWEGLVRGHRVRTGQEVILADGTLVVVGEVLGGIRLISFPPDVDVVRLLRTQGELPLPPYIREYHGDPSRYQTVYAAEDGSAAAPTAGLHFTPELIEQLQAQGIGWATVTLHVGLDTFRHVDAEDVRQHHIHTEWIQVGADVVEQVRNTKRSGGRVLAVGTTSVRALEHAAADGELIPYEGPADLFIVPGYSFRVVDALLTNFHLPRTSLLLLVAALIGRERMFAAYEEAIRERYRFFSFGDAMLIR